MAQVLDFNTLKRTSAKPQRKSKKRFYVILLVAISITLSIFLISKASNPRPGDLLFSVKSILEERAVPQDASQKLDYQIGIINDRIKAVNELSAENNCVQLIIAEENLYNQISTARDIITSDEALKNGYEKIYLELKDLSSSSCAIRTKTLGLSTVFELLAVKNGAQLDFDTLIEESQSEYTNLVNKLRTTSFSDQETLNEINSSVERAKYNVDIYQQMKENSEFEKLIFAIISNKFIFNIINSELGNVESIISQEDIVRGYCEINSQNENCSESNLSSQWNSIYSRQSKIDQIEIGNDLLANIIQ